VKPSWADLSGENQAADELSSSTREKIKFFSRLKDSDAPHVTVTRTSVENSPDAVTTRTKQQHVVSLGSSTATNVTSAGEGQVQHKVPETVPLNSLHSTIKADREASPKVLNYLSVVLKKQDVQKKIIAEEKRPMGGGSDTARAVSVNGGSLRNEGGNAETESGIQTKTIPSYLSVLKRRKAQSHGPVVSAGPTGVANPGNLATAAEKEDPAIRESLVNSSAAGTSKGRKSKSVPCRGDQVAQSPQKKTEECRFRSLWQS
jgi:hypothetical protein